MSIPAVLLDAVTGTGAGDTKTATDLAPPGMSHNGVLHRFAVVATYATAAPTAATIKLQGSVDNTNWVDLGNTTDVSATTVGFAVVNMPFPHLRGNLTAYTAGSCTGVTVKCVGSI